jgi:AbrB family looped-hinge helix DNA binding protein
MVYHTTITKKGQMVIPKALRDEIGIKNSQKLAITFEKNKNELRIRPVEDILDLAGKYKAKKPVSALATREKFEKKYGRR